MSNLRFYNPAKLALGAIIKLTENAATHATRVLRLNLGDKLNLFNGDGFDYAAELISVKKNEVLAKIKSRHSVENESPLRITLLQGISSGDRMDYTLQKAVELGVSTIQPINTQRSIVKLTGDRIEKRLEHWQNVVIAACEQSGRAFVPPVLAPATLVQWLSKVPNHTTETRITLAPTATQSLQHLPKPVGEIYLLIGAEGGLNDDEINLAAMHGFVGVQLGKRILRTETAPLAAMSVMQALWGDF